ncbi:PEP-CTERM sorting domain-containing protein [Aurantiacibacter luteus]|uniref:PEP-CTERM sorting domain-containing protein n=1 Tax=Aurantiacibacter luteus TaxID=1581420 RepID=UPI00138E3EAB|nr:PEP-CTERM sorting domain-containing protein [Aurantiacibacter luteus]
MTARFVLAAFATLAVAVPAAAQATQVPEASSMTLFAMGAAGVMIGRRLARRKADRDS